MVVRLTAWLRVGRRVEAALPYAKEEIPPSGECIRNVGAVRLRGVANEDCPLLMPHHDASTAIASP